MVDPVAGCVLTVISANTLVLPFPLRFLICKNGEASRKKAANDPSLVNATEFPAATVPILLRVVSVPLLLCQILANGEARVCAATKDPSAEMPQDPSPVGPLVASDPLKV